jgi:hypothetical protein
MYDLVNEQENPVGLLVWLEGKDLPLLIGDVNGCAGECGCCSSNEPVVAYQRVYTTPSVEVQKALDPGLADQRAAIQERFSIPSGDVPFVGNGRILSWESE